MSVYFLHIPSYFSALNSDDVIEGFLKYYLQIL